MIEARVGEAFEVDLTATPATGYRWEHADLPAAVEHVEATFLPRSAAPGEGGTQRFRFRARTPGRYTLEFQLKRPWEQDAAETHTVEVEVS